MFHQVANGITQIRIAVVFAMPEPFKFAPSAQIAFQRSLGLIQIFLGWDLAAFSMEIPTIFKGERSDSMAHARFACLVDLILKTDLST